MSSRNGPRKKSRGNDGKMAYFLIGILVMSFVCIGAWVFTRSLVVLTWKSAPCVVTKLSPTDDSNSKTPFSLEVEFRFELDGRGHQGKKLGIQGWENSRDQIKQLLQLEKQPRTICYFPRGKPERSALFKPSIEWVGLVSIAVGLAFGWIFYQSTQQTNSTVIVQKVLPVVGLLFGIPGLILLVCLSFPV